MKKNIKICAIMLAISMLAIVFAACSCGGEPGVIENQTGTYYTNIDTVITYKLDGQDVSEKLKEEKSLSIQGVLNGDDVIELNKKPDCTFSKSFMVTYMDKEYQIAQDGCNCVKYQGKYYKIPVSDRMILNDIFKDAGVSIKNNKVVENHV